MKNLVTILKLAMTRCLLFSFLIFCMGISCNNEAKYKDSTASEKEYQPGTFGYDLNFLLKYDSAIILKSKDGNAQVIVSPKYQAKVFTSTASGLTGISFGWINYKAFSSPVNEHMNAYGGENRFWLGPEGGIFSLYFRKGDSMLFDNWRTPAPIDVESWIITENNSTKVSMKKPMNLTNYSGFTMELMAERTVEILETDKIFLELNIKDDTSVKAVGYLTQNFITNIGSESWNEKTGMPCIWILDMFNPTDKTVIIIPYKEVAKNQQTTIATTDYFGEISNDRIKYQNGVLLFKADGKSRGKLGLSPQRSKPVAGSYDALNNVLTITLFDINEKAKYLNQEWNIIKQPFSGDAVNAYNDGPLEDGSQMGPFYEIESVSPAAFLKPTETLSHNHTVIHITGNINKLSEISLKVLGISIKDIQNAFN